MPNCPLVCAPRLSAASIRFFLLCLSAGSVSAQSLQITSPADGTMVNPGQSLTVTVSAMGTFQQVILIGGDPIGFSQPLSAPPYQFTIQIPSHIVPGRYQLTADGATAPGQGAASDPITLVVERADAPVSLRAQPALLHFSAAGQKGYLRVIGTFADGTTTDLTKSGLTTYTSPASVATAGTYGIVTASAGPTAGVIQVAYASLSVFVPVTVDAPLKIAPRQKALYASQTQQFTAQPAGLSNPTITWSINPVGVGTVDATGMYTAPSSVTARQTVTVAATNAADNTQFASANVILYPPLTITVSPGAVDLKQSQSQLFGAKVANAIFTDVVWYLSPNSPGSLDQFGHYTAPASITSQQTVIVQAISAFDGVTIGSAAVTLVPSGVTPTVTFTGAPASAAYGSAFTVTASTNASTTPTIAATGVCSISGNVVTITGGAGTCQLTANWPADQNYLAASASQSTTAAKAMLTATANNATRVYGGANPSFTASFSGLANGDTLATAASGSSSLTTQATPASLPGTYSIVAALGTLFSTNYAFAFVNGTLTVTPTGSAPASGTACNGAYNGTFTGNVTASSGQTCIFVSGGITGNVTLSGASLTLSNATVGGNVTGQGNVGLTGTGRVNGSVTLSGGRLSAGSGAAIGGNVTLSGGSNLTLGNASIGASLVMNNGGNFSIGPAATITGSLTIQAGPAGSAQNQACGTTIRGNATLQSNGGAIQIGSASPAACAGNTIGGNLVLQQNTGSTGIFDNTVTGNLVCQNNSSITGAGNTAQLRLGQCAAF